MNRAIFILKNKEFLAPVRSCPDPGSIYTEPKTLKGPDHGSVKTRFGPDVSSQETQYSNTNM